MFPASEHDAIWKVQETLNFPLTVYGLQRSEASMTEITRRLSHALGSHLDDKSVPDPTNGRTAGRVLSFP